jgi:hypothetical protein
MDPSTQAALAELLGLGGLEDEESLLEKELARAEALRGQSGPYYGPAAGILGGVGDAIRNIASYTQGAELSRALRGNIEQQKAARTALGPAALGLLGLGQQPNMGMEMSVAAPTDLFGFGG